MNFSLFSSRILYCFVIGKQLKIQRQISQKLRTSEENVIREISLQCLI